MDVNNNNCSLEPPFVYEQLHNYQASRLSGWCQVILACIIGVCCLALLRRYLGTANRLWYIPGPICLPLIGSVLSIGSSPHLTFTYFRKKYGDMFRIQVGSIPVLVLSGYDITKEALVDQGDVFSGRPDLFTFKLASEGRSMAFNSYSPQWRLHRRVAERALKIATKRTGFVKNVVNKEAGLLADTLLEEASSRPQDPVNYVTWSVAHVMYSLCFGDSRESPDFVCMINNTLRLIHCHKLGNILNFFPWAQRILKSALNELQEICGNIIKITKIHEERHLETYQSGRIRDALDALIHINEQSPCSQERDRVMHTVQEFIGAGMDIVYLTLTWALRYLTMHPDLRSRLVAEVDSVVGPGRQPTVADLKNMPFTHAFILETLRFSSVVPFALPHSTLQDTELGGYSIPAGTFVLVNLHAINSDPNIWGDPNVFRPSRFITQSGDIDSEVLRFFCPFGMGRRKCIGESVSIDQLFVYLTVLLQKCEFLQLDSHCDSIASGSGILVKPEPFVVQVKARS